MMEGLERTGGQAMMGGQATTGGQAMMEGQATTDDHPRGEAKALNTWIYPPEILRAVRVPMLVCPQPLQRGVLALSFSHLGHDHHHLLRPA